MAVRYFNPDALLLPQKNCHSQRLSSARRHPRVLLTNWRYVTSNVKYIFSLEFKSHIKRGVPRKRRLFRPRLDARCSKAIAFFSFTRLFSWLENKGPLKVTLKIISFGGKISFPSFSFVQTPFTFKRIYAPQRYASLNDVESVPLSESTSWEVPRLLHVSSIFSLWERQRRDGRHVHERFDVQLQFQRCQRSQDEISMVRDSRK